MRNDEFGTLPPEDAPLGDEFHAAKDPSFVKQNRSALTAAANKKRQHIKFLMKMFASTTAAVVVISTTPGWEALAERNHREPAQSEAYTEAEEAAISSESYTAGGVSEGNLTEGSTSSEENSAEASNVAESSEAETTSETESSEPETLFCGTCYGTGICLTCHGNGYVQCATINSGCSLCKGSGVKVCPDCGGESTCHSCGGSGEGTVAVDAEYVQCETCEGNGILCGGSAAADDPEGCHGSVVSHCRACNNTGLQNGKPCSWCKGTLVHLCPSFEVHRTCPDCNGLGLVPVPQ